MFNREKIRALQIRLNSAYMITDLDMSDHQRRDLVTELREIATELDCLKPVDEVHYLDQEASERTFNEACDKKLVEAMVTDPIPAAPGPDYATRNELDALRASVNGADFVTRDFVLKLVDRVVRLEEDILGDEHVLSLSGRVLAMEKLWQATRSGAVGGTIAERWQQVRVGIEASLLSGSEGNCHYLLDEIGALIGDCKSGTHIAATVEQAVQGRRTELYNQAYLAALPFVIAKLPDDAESAKIVAWTHHIATQSMEYLK